LISEDTTDEAIDRLIGKLRKVREDLKNSQEDDLVNLEAQITDYQLISLIAAFREAEVDILFYQRKFNGGGNPKGDQEKEEQA
jgi:hypothetical protein